MGLDNPLHIAFLLIVLLLVFGAKRLPEIGRSIGTGMREFKDSISATSHDSAPVLQQSPQPQVPIQQPVQVAQPQPVAAPPQPVQTAQAVAAPAAPAQAPAGSPAPVSAPAAAAPEAATAPAQAPVEPARQA